MRYPFAEYISVEVSRINAYDRFMPGATAAPEPGANYMSSSIILLHPFSRGSVHITSTDPNAAPNIDTNSLDNDVDLKILLQGYRIVRNLSQIQPLNDIIDSEVSPGVELEKDEEIIAYIRKTVGSAYHPAGTVSMLPHEEGGCVNQQLKVYGTSNLRVVSP